MVSLILLSLTFENVHVLTHEELDRALQVAKPGTRISIAPGEYRGGVFAKDLHGEDGRWIVVSGADEENPPVFRGGGTGMQFSKVSYFELRDVVIEGAEHNGVNIDDAGSILAPSHHVIVRGVQVRDLPKGNRDGIKLSGVDDFQVLNCRVDRWGGSGIDMVGCHRGLVSNSSFWDGGDNSIQSKGGSSEIQIEKCRFVRFGQRGVNIGGSTGIEFFRPSLESMGKERYEARGITVVGNHFIEGGAPVAFVGVDGATVRFNSIYKPGKWAMRILQETREPGFVPSRNGIFESNLVVFDSRKWSEGGVNIGSGTSPETFRFSHNFWYCIDTPRHSKPKLPVAEESGVVGVDPGVSVGEDGILRVGEGSAAARVGAHAWKRLN